MGPARVFRRRKDAGLRRGYDVLQAARRKGVDAHTAWQPSLQAMSICRGLSGGGGRSRQSWFMRPGDAVAFCGYARNRPALHFDHLDPPQKRHEIDAKGVAIALDKLRVEARKCVLLCSNCHAEVEDGMASIPAICCSPRVAQLGGLG